MIQQSNSELSADQLKQLLNELAMRSMSGVSVDATEVGVLCERLAIFGNLAEDAGMQDVSELSKACKAELAAAQPSKFLVSLRESITRLQESFEASLNTTKATPTSSGEAQEANTNTDLELVLDFIVESREHLVTAEEQSLALEKSPDDIEAINAMFRAFHSIKGLAAFLDFDRVYRFAHEVETLLDYARNRELRVTPAVIDLVLASADFLNQCMQAIEENRLPSLPKTEDKLISRIREMIDQCAKPSETPAPATESTTEPVAVDSIMATESSTTPEHRATPPAPAEPEPIPVAKETSAEQAPKVQPPANVAANVPTPPAQEAPQQASGKESRQQSSEWNSIRVDTSKLDYLMDMVGELVIAQSMVRTGVTEEIGASSTLLRSIAQLSQISGEVQRTALRMRMVPIGQLLRKTGRIVRDLSRKFGKAVDVEIAGEDTEVDKTIAEELADPLMHIVRNAVDHGIETPEQRAATTKPATATVSLAARHEGSQIVVVVSDDGRGLNREKILKTALERNLVTRTDLSYAEVIDLIFQPGFSTADKVTTVSGRGVGMDVVRRHVEKLRGRVDVESVPGKGTTFTIRLPLTRAIIDGLIVKVGDSRYVVPMSSVRELFRPTESAISTVQSKAELVMLHSRLLPIVRLHRKFSIPAAIEDPCQAVMVVAENDGHQFCLMVDELLGKQEVVVKSLGESLKNTPGVSGGTILGDGRVGLILDVQQIEGIAS